MEDGGRFEALVKPLLQPAFRLAYGMLGDRSAAEDAVQEATFRAWRKLGNLRPGHDFSPWFLAIVANECRHLRRARWWSVLKLAAIDRQQASAQIFPSSRVDLWRAFQRLPQRQQVALLLRYYLDLPLDQVAEALGVSSEAAKSITHRGLRTLRPLLMEEGA
jgi:RNA polymerase sigma-70 factor (ECF subfamily)